MNLGFVLGVFRYPWSHRRGWRGAAAAVWRPEASGPLSGAVPLRRHAWMGGVVRNVGGLTSPVPVVPLFPFLGRGSCARCGVGDLFYACLDRFALCMAC